MAATVEDAGARAEAGAPAAVAGAAATAADRMAASAGCYTYHTQQCCLVLQIDVLPTWSAAPNPAFSPPPTPLLRRKNPKKAALRT